MFNMDHLELYEMQILDGDEEELTLQLLEELFANVGTKMEEDTIFALQK